MNEPYLSIILLSFIGLLELLFSIFILVKYNKSPAIIYFGLLALCISGWVLSNGLGLLFERGSIGLDIVARSTFVFALFIFNFLYLFILYFPYPVKDIDGHFLLFLFLQPILLSILLYASDVLVVGFKTDPMAQTIHGSVFWLYALYIFFMFLFSLVLMVQKISKLDGLHRWQMKMLLTAILISGIIGITNNIVLPYFFDIRTLDWIGPGSSIIWLGFMWSILKKR